MKLKCSGISLARLGSILLLTACGGGGGAPTAPVTPPVQQYAYGIWDSAITKMLVLPNGAFYQWFGTAIPIGQLHGSLTVNASNQLSYITSYGMYNGLYEQNWTVTSSSIVTSSTLAYSAIGGVVSSPSTIRTYNFVFNNSYNSSFTNVDLTGSYSGISMGQNSTFSIDNAGIITGLYNSCSFNGTISPNASKGYGLVSMTISGVNCSSSSSGGPAIGYLIKSGSGVGQQLWIGVSEGLFTTTAYGYSLVGVKQ